MPMDSKHGTVVIVDDDTGVLKRLERLLRFEGYPNIALCERADDAWPVLRSGKVLAMVLDLMMPRMMGPIKLSSHTRILNMLRYRPAASLFDKIRFIF